MEVWYLYFCVQSAQATARHVALIKNAFRVAAWKAIITTITPEIANVCSFF